MNVNSIRNKIAQAISKMPTTVVLERYIKYSDGMGGFTKSKYPQVIATFEGMLDNSDHAIYVGDTITKDAAKIQVGRKNKLYTVWSPDYEILADDFFIINSIKYTIKNAVDILNMHIYFECDLEDEEVVS